MSLLENSLSSSPSKQKFSFPKDQRFKERFQSNCSQAFYVLPPITSTKASSLGYGNKYDFSKMANKNPGPNSYEVPREFDPKKIDKKGISFGIGRENLYTSNKNINPGPGTYNTKGALNNRDISFGLKGSDGLVPKNLLHNPGPGSYHISPLINAEGKYFISKVRNLPVHSFNPPHSVSPFARESRNPGPGHYTLKTDFNPTGSYFVAKYRSHNAFTIPNSNRTEPIIKSMAQNPGPGAYGYVSDFGPLPPIKPVINGSTMSKASKTEPGMGTKTEE